MTAERWQQIVRLAETAGKLHGNDRGAFLERHCSADDTLRREVESLLESDRQAKGFIEEPVTRLAGDLITDDKGRPRIGQQIGHYVILKLLGTGGMGEVYLAQDTSLNREVALKFLAAELTSDQDRVRRFQQEARAISALNHPNILTVHEIGESDLAFYIATEYVSGETLRERMRRSRLDLKAALDITIQVATALVAAHAAGIIHRDIKPENVMIRPDGYVKVLDFGLAKLAEQESTTSNPQHNSTLTVRTEPGLIMGTPKYMSPEQVRGIDVDGRSDIFSLGVVFYEMVTGRLPFDGPTASDVMAAVLTGEVSPLSNHLASTPNRLQALIDRALAKTKDSRYQSAIEILRDLEALRKQPVLEDTESGPLLKSVPIRTSNPNLAAKPEFPSQKGGLRARIASGTGYAIGNVVRHKLVSASTATLVMALVALLVFRPYSVRSQDSLDSLVILPFTNPSGDTDLDVLSDGIVESMISSLSQIRGLRVMSRTSVLRYKGRQIEPRVVGQDLNVRAVLVGQINRDGDELSIKLELVDAKDNSRLWGDAYKRGFSELLKLQAEISSQVAIELRVRLNGSEEKKVAKQYTESVEAYVRYIKGRYYWGKRTGEDLKKGIEFFKEAIDLDPYYALAYTGLADSYHVLWVYTNVSPRDTYQQAKAAAFKALELDSQLAEAHTSLGSIKVDDEWDFSGGENEFKRAIELNPQYTTAHQWYAEYLANVGRVDEALDHIEQALAVDPVSANLNTERGYILLRARRYGEAIDQLKSAIGINEGFYLAHNNLGDAYAETERIEEAIAEHRIAAVLAGGDSDVADKRAAVLTKAYLEHGSRGYWGKRLELGLKEVQSGRVVSHFVNDGSAYRIAGLLARLGQREEAFKWLQKAYDERDDFILLLRSAPQFDALRSDPRAIDLMKRIGLM